VTKPLSGRCAIVTGASRGIGAATARALHGAGARVALVARGNAALEAIAGELGDGAEPVSCDVTDRNSVTRAAARIVNVLGGAPDMLVNSVGAFRLAPFMETTPADLEESLAANALGPFLFTRTFLPEMIARRSGHVVNVGSVADHVVLPGNASYSAGKFALRALHEVLALELRGSGVRATLVSPGATDTPLWDDIDPDSRNGFTPRAAMLRAGEVADAILYAVTRPDGVSVDAIHMSPAR
jgi:NAD(P)-dependent dehydrogenase (short-subunit alcohol dehydrogenase family)